MKTYKNKTIKVPKGFFMAGEVIYPNSQFAEVITAQAMGKPLPPLKNPCVQN